MPFPVEKPLVLVVGPTAVGKTALSLKLAEDLKGEIISADSRLFYRSMDIGTAKPTLEERSRIRHHLIDVADIDETWSLATFQKAVYKNAEEIRMRGNWPFVVGGTGQYIRSIIEGWIIPAQSPNNELRNEIKKWGVEIGTENIYSKLNFIDPRAAENIEPNNLRRIIRALEVIFLTGRLFSEERRKDPIDFQYKMVGLTRDRKPLYERVDRRIEKMIQSGFIEEVKKIINEGYDQNLPSLSAIGYKEMTMMLNEEISQDEAIRLIKRRTRQYIRRQANWFKKDDMRIKWFNMDDFEYESILNFIRSSDGWFYE